MLQENQRSHSSPEYLIATALKTEANPLLRIFAFYAGLLHPEHRAEMGQVLYEKNMSQWLSPQGLYEDYKGTGLYFFDSGGLKLGEDGFSINHPFRNITDVTTQELILAELHRVHTSREIFIQDVLNANPPLQQAHQVVADLIRLRVPNSRAQKRLYTSSEAYQRALIETALYFGYGDPSSLQRALGTRTSNSSVYAKVSPAKSFFL